jgi:hypothetical protein
LEPASQLAALNLPPDEIGVIKEGQATRYLNGQHLWDKKFHRAAKQVEKHRKKNLKEARERDGHKIARFWEDRLKRYQEHESENEHESGSGSGNRNGNGNGTETEGDDGWETDGAGIGQRDMPEDAEGKQQRGRRVLDQSWSWDWALHGEAPPPSAIVSRRDFVSSKFLSSLPPLPLQAVEAYLSS